MNTSDDESPDELTREYRRASAEQAGRPAAATRAAILARARAAALRRAPAVNDSRVWWRAAASVAVLGVAIVLWRQVDRDPARETRAEPEQNAAAPPPMPAAAPEPAKPASDAAPPALIRRGALDSSEALGASADRAREAARAELAPAAVSAAAAVQILKRYFPSEYASSSPSRGLWVVQDAAGNVVRTGQLEADEEFSAVTVRMERELGGRSIGPWSVTPVTNASGVAMQLGMARVQ